MGSTLLVSLGAGWPVQECRVVRRDWALDCRNEWPAVEAALTSCLPWAVHLFMSDRDIGTNLNEFALPDIINGPDGRPADSADHVVTWV
jgi:hypothetical protein